MASLGTVLWNAWKKVAPYVGEAIVVFIASLFGGNFPIGG